MSEGIYCVSIKTIIPTTIHSIFSPSPFFLHNSFSLSEPVVFRKRCTHVAKIYYSFNKNRLWLLIYQQPKPVSFYLIIYLAPLS